MKKLVKKLSLFLVIVVMVTTLVTPAIGADAASIPTIAVESGYENSTIYVGETGKLVFLIANVNTTQEYIVNVYDSNNKVVASARKASYDYSYQTTRLTLNIDTATLGLTVGKYLVEYYMIWEDSTSSTGWMQNNPHNYTNLYVSYRPEFKLEGSVYRYYENGAPSTATGLVKHNNQYFYLVNGYWKNNFDGLVKYGSKYFYVENGKWNSSYTGLTKYNGTWFYIQKGKWASTVTTLVKVNGKWLFVQNGKWTAQNVLVKYKGKYFYVKGGKWQSTYDGFVYYKGTYFYIVNGKWANGTTTLVKYKGLYHYVKKGKFCETTAIVKYKGKKFYVWDGVAQTKFSGKVKVNGKTYKIKKGKVV